MFAFPTNKNIVFLIRLSATKAYQEFSKYEIVMTIKVLDEKKTEQRHACLILHEFFVSYFKFLILRHLGFPGYII